MLAVFFIAVILTSLATAWWIKYNIYASIFRPVKLSEKEQDILEGKLDLLDRSARLSEKTGAIKYPSGARLKPEPYKEFETDREIRAERCYRKGQENGRTRCY